MCCRDALWALALAACLAACADTTPEAPSITGVTPDRGRNSVVTPITIRGVFRPLVQANLDDEDRAGVSTAFTVQLATTPARTDLSRVRFQRDDSGATWLTAEVPRGIAPGRYELRVLDPRGREARWSAFAVTSGADGGVDAGPDAGPDQRLTDGPAPEGPGPDLKPRDGPVPDTPVTQPDTTPPGKVSTIAGTGSTGLNNGAAAAATFNNPMGVAVKGKLIYVADYSNYVIRRIDTSKQTVATLAGSGKQGSTDGSAASAEFNFPVGLALDAAGNVYVADSSNDVIRKIDATGKVSTFAGSGTKGFADGSAKVARFNYPYSVAVSGTTLYVADTQNHRIRKIDAAGTVSTLAGNALKGFVDGTGGAARFDSPEGVEVAGGTIYVADSENHAIRAVTTAGKVTTVAGTGTKGAADGAAKSAQFWRPTDLAVNGSTIYVVDQSNHRIRVISGGTVSTLSGSYFGHKDGPIASALYYYPHGIAVDSQGDLYIADKSNQRVRKITF